MSGVNSLKTVLSNNGLLDQQTKSRVELRDRDNMQINPGAVSSLDQSRLTTDSREDCLGLGLGLDLAHLLVLDGQKL